MSTWGVEEGSRVYGKEEAAKGFTGRMGRGEGSGILKKFRGRGREEASMEM